MPRRYTDRRPRGPASAPRTPACACENGRGSASPPSLRSPIPGIRPGYRWCTAGRGWRRRHGRHRVASRSPGECRGGRPSEARHPAPVAVDPRCTAARGRDSPMMGGMGPIAVQAGRPAGRYRVWGMVRSRHEKATPEGDDPRSGRRLFRFCVGRMGPTGVGAASAVEGSTPTPARSAADSSRTSSANRGSQVG